MTVDILVTLVLIVLYLFLGHWYRNRNSKVKVWPVVGMLPTLVSNVDRIFDFLTDLVKLNGGTFKFQGPWFSSLNFVVTAHPVNINHILCRNHENYGKGQEFREIFEPFGEGLVTSDSHVWKRLRKVLQPFTKNNKKYAAYLDRILRQMVEGSLIPVLQHVVRLGTEVDLEDLLHRFDYDYICLLTLGCNPKTLSVEFPVSETLKAFEGVEEALLYRNFVPKMVWRLQKWIQIGEEKKLSKGLKTVDDFMYGCILSRRKELRRSGEAKAEVDDQFDLLTAFMVEEEGSDMCELGKSDKFLRDTAYNFITAGMDSTNVNLTWFFWLIGTHPWVENKIVEEMKANCPESIDGKMLYFSGEELNKFVYLHAALCETMRLYPTVPLNNKTSVEADVLPNGGHIGPNTRIFISMYSMGRSEEIWGEDCLEFKPERWISEEGKIAYKPTSTFVPFGAGARVCLGKDLCFKMMKTVAINVVWNYQVELVEKQNVVMSSKAIALHTEHGLKVRIKKRQ
ncbi:hypothetical protein GQ457_05G018650 [Hibiscus cannabinus]